MGCFPCRKDDISTLSFNLAINENYVTVQPNLSLATSLETSANNSNRRCMHNMLKPSRECHTKFRIDRDVRWQKLLIRKKIILLAKRRPKTADVAPSIDSHSQRRSSQEDVKEEKSKDSLRPPEVNLNPFGIPRPTTPTGKSMPGRNLDSVTEMAIRHQFSKSRKGNDTGTPAASYLSVNSIAFDPSFLVVENKGSLTDTYQVLDVIGHGTFGEVRKVQHKQTKKIYAVKAINKNCYMESENMLNEIEILKSLVCLAVQKSE